MKVQVKNASDSIELVIPDSDTITFPSKFNYPIAPGFITDRVKRVDLQYAPITELAPGAIPNSVTHLFLKVLTKDMTIPESVTDLFIRGFEQDMIEFVPATVVNLYIHMSCRSCAPVDRTHYVFYFGSLKISKSRCNPQMYTFEDPHNIKPFDEKLRIMKRVPKKVSKSLASVLVESLAVSSQTITVGKTYTDITFDADAELIEFPDSVYGCIRPGSLDHLTKLRKIRWGVSMTDLIEPGTFPKQCIALLLPASYKHPYEASEFRSDIWVYIHESNLAYAPVSTERFNVWSEVPITEIPGFVQIGSPKRSIMFDVYMCEIKRDNKPAPVPVPLPVIDPAPTPVCATETDAKPAEPATTNSLSKFKITSSDFADLVTKSKLNSNILSVTTKRAYEIAGYIHARLMKAATDGTAHMGFKSVYAVRSDHSAAVTKLLAETFPFAMISQRGDVLTVNVPASP